jgi:threonine synthase
VAGLIKNVKAGRFEEGSTLVLTLTGHGLKDPDTALESATRPTDGPAGSPNRPGPARLLKRFPQHA